MARQIGSPEFKRVAVVQRCHQEGRMAKLAGERASACPYPDDRADERAGWLEGWTVAQPRLMVA